MELTANPQVNNYGFRSEVVSQAIKELESLGNVLQTVLDVAPSFVAWQHIDRRAPEEFINGESVVRGYGSLDAALVCYLWKVKAMVNMLTTNTDGLLDPVERKERDKGLYSYLSRVQAKYQHN